MAKGKAQLQKDADIARRKAVDAKNAADANREKKAAEKLAKTPLTEKEQAFVVKIAAKMNNGRAVDAPSSAEILKYSKLVGRKDIPRPEEGESAKPEEGE
ncbi:hypothetical protein KAR91_45000 [Candidatus Pacearchaeota archaeon]|nr:hypothetical protein [Candidatus Pacearchaeota archaeon]